MIVPVIDVSQFLDINNFSISELKEVSQQAVIRVTNAIADKIKSYTGTDLHSTRGVYDMALKTSFGELNGVISLTGLLPLMIENGMSPFDMKIGFANSSKAKRTKPNQDKFSKGGKMDWKEQGWYLTIPFRKGTPNSLAENFAGRMEQPIYQQIKGQVATLKNNGSYLSKGLNMDQLRAAGAKFIERETNPHSGYTHKNPINEGLARSEGRDYQKTTQSTYVSFRRVSNNSDSNSWLNKGIKKHNFFERALANVDSDLLVVELLDKYIDTLY